MTFGTPIDVCPIFSFIVYGTTNVTIKAQDAIDNMDMNELRGKVLKVSLARPQRAPVQGAGNRAGMKVIFD